MLMSTITRRANRRFACATIPSSALAATVSAAAFCSACANAELLPIINPGFEMTSRPLAPGEITNGAGGAGVFVGTRFPWAGGGVSFDDPVEVPGWRTLLPPPQNPNATIYAGVLNPPILSSGGNPVPFMTGYEGQYIAAVQHSSMQQTLNVQVQPNVHYCLSFLAGNGMFDQGQAVYVGLLASPDLETLAFFGTPNVTKLVQTQGVVVPPGSDGTMTTFQIEYTSPAVLPLNVVNRYLAITFIGSDGIPRMCFDVFRLVETPVPGPASFGVVALLVGASHRSVRRRRCSE
jgi:hypothetical protein